MSKIFLILMPIFSTTLNSTTFKQKQHLSALKDLKLKIPSKRISNSLVNKFFLKQPLSRSSNGSCGRFIKNQPSNELSDIIYEIHERVEDCSLSLKRQIEISKETLEHAKNSFYANFVSGAAVSILALCIAIYLITGTASKHLAGALRG